MDQKQNSKPKDPENPASKPNATTQDQIANMESEGQAQQPGQEPSGEGQDSKERTSQKNGNGGPDETPGPGDGGA